MRRFRWVIGGGLLVLLACSGGVPQPVEIALNEETCSHCRMAVSQREFAGEVVAVSGSLDVFDDIGCLGQWMADHEPPESAGVFVVDFESGEWLDAKAARYVRSENLPTPMSFGLAAFKSDVAARAAADELDGEVIVWSQVLAGEYK